MHIGGAEDTMGTWQVISLPFFGFRAIFWRMANFWQNPVSQLIALIAGNYN